MKPEKCAFFFIRDSKRDSGDYKCTYHSTVYVYGIFQCDGEFIFSYYE